MRALVVLAAPHVRQADPIDGAIVLLEKLHEPVDARAIFAAPFVGLGFRGAPAVDAIAILRAEHDDSDVARIGAERLLQLSHIVGRAVAHQTVEIVALARDRHARPGSERLDETAHQSFGKPIADNLDLIDVVIGERGDEAAAKTLLLRGRGHGPHEQERHEDGGEKGADQVDVPWLEPVAPNPGDAAALSPLRRPRTRRKRDRKGGEGHSAGFVKPRAWTASRLSTAPALA